MRSVEESFAIISRQLEKSANHLNQHSSRKDLAEGNYLAIKELSKLQNQVLIMQETLKCEELKITKMQKVWNDQLLRLYLFLSLMGYSSHDFFTVIQQPIDLLITPLEASIKSEIPVKQLSFANHTVEESISLIEENEKRYALIEEKLQKDLMTTKCQIEQLVSKSLNR